MPQESQLAHRVLSSLDIPYITNASPSSTDPRFIAGSQNVLTSINGYLERRPGFSQFVEPTPTTFNNLSRLFTWENFAGQFFVMACDINASGFAVVYKMQVGVDASFVSIYTEPSASGVPFDFVFSNNTVYFSNGSQAQKWDAVNGISNWGIAPYVQTTTQALYAGTGADGGGAHVWTNPGNIVGAPNAAYATNVNSKNSGSFLRNVPNELKATNYSFTTAATATVSGIQVVATGHITTNSGGMISPGLYAQLLINGSPAGSVKSIAFSSTGDINVTFGGSTDLWGLSNVGGAVTTTTTFGVQFTFDTLSISIPLNAAWNVTVSLDAAQITVFSSGPPTVALAAGPPNLTATVGYQYVVCYGNSRTGHIGSPSPPSSLVKPTNQFMQITVQASTDPQVNQIHIYRTTDSASGLGGQSYFEIPGSPVNNANQTVNDGAADTQLATTSIAPTPTFNDPVFNIPSPGPGAPAGGFRGMAYYSGRIWGFTGNKVWFTGLEEITVGVPEECIPSGIAGNYWSFDQPVQGLGVAGSGANQVLAIFTGGRIYVISGNTLDTFVRTQVSNRRGTRNLTTISTLGGMIAWFDSAEQMWASDGTNLNEVSPMIRPDLASLNPATCSTTFHTAGRFHWMVFSTGTNLYLYDVDQDQWMPPWTFSAKYIYSGETSPGNYVLMASTGTQAVQMNPAMTAGTFNDVGATYQPILKLGLLSVVPDYGTRFSYIGVGSYNEPTRTGYPAMFQVTNNGTALADILIATDENPATAAYTSIATNAQDTAITYNRVNGTSMKQWVFPTIQPAARWVGMQVDLANADQVDQVYEIFMAYKSLGGR